MNPYRRTTAPSATQRHLMNRMGCGWSRSTFARMRAAGSAGAWFEGQLRPGSVKESAKAGELAGWFPDLWESPRTKWERNRSGSKGGWEYAADLASWSMLRRVYSERQVLETMVEVWSDHLHVHANGDLAWVQRAGYDATIRKHALGTFEDLLVACTLHPAMLLYLDNWRSVKGAPNENHGRELLELHTVGRVSGYTEQMVKDSARILSGFTVDAFGSWDGFYDPARHTTGAVQVLGFTHANGVRRRPGDDARLPALPGTAPRHRPQRRALGWPASSSPTSPRRRWSTTSRRCSATPAPTSGRRCARWWRTRVQGVQGPAGAHADRGLRGDLPGAPRGRAGADRLEVVRAGGGVGPADHARLPLAASGRAAVRRRRLGLGHPHAELLPDALEPHRAAGGRPRTSATGSPRAGCPSGRSAWTGTSTT